MNLQEQAYTAKLKPMNEAVKAVFPTNGKFYHYEPGNGTRYEVFISRRKPAWPHDSYPELVVSIMNFDRPCSMTVPLFAGQVDVHPGYVKEKMGILIGDALAICELLAHYTEETNG